MSATNVQHPLIREVMGQTLRTVRKTKGLTLREVSMRARVSLGYLSEVERGRKECSSEILVCICEALEITLSQLLGSISRQLAAAENTAA